MLVLDSPAAVRRQVRDWKREGLVVGFVPTMGALHAGHTSLVAAALAAGADRVVASIFVNPTQFGPTEDLAAYPRDLEGDKEKLALAGVHLLFTPGVTDIYPPGAETRVTLDRLPAHLCGLSRPVHFGGVATVVTVLFNVVEPDLAVFGEKDFQQVRVIQRLVRDLHLPVRVVAAPTLRESDGLAMSSRNAYLSPDERARAPALFAALVAARDAVAAGEQSGARIEAQIAAAARAAGGDVDYVAVVDEETLESVSAIAGPVRAVLAVRFGRARLIDNLRIGKPVSSN